MAFFSGIFLDSLGGGPYTDGERVEGGGAPPCEPVCKEKLEMKKKAKKEDMKKGGKKGK